jgi:nitroimidazol reductase NimA-like FMN-containing flavoprotein (pyridoxamine 5'-phosphate oxidase superfamily)
MRAVGQILALSSEDMEKLLRTSIVGRIACCAHGLGDDGRPYLVPLSYGYDGKALYAHSGAGKKIRIMRSQPLVTIEVDQAEAADCWRSVIANGMYEELKGAADRALAISIIYPNETSRPTFSDKVVFFRILLSEKSGRFEAPDPVR